MSSGLFGSTPSKTVFIEMFTNTTPGS